MHWHISLHVFNAFLQEHRLVAQPVLHLQLQFASKASGAQFPSIHTMLILPSGLNFQPWLTGVGALMLEHVDRFHIAAW